MNIFVIPAQLRRCYWLLVVAVGIAGAWIWFGNAGVALISLWCAAAPPWRQHAFHLLRVPTRVTVIEPWRIVFHDNGTPIEVFRDEVSAADWAWLRREALALSSAARVIRQGVSRA